MYLPFRGQDTAEVHLTHLLMHNIIVVKVIMLEESLPQGIEGDFISVSTIKLIFAQMKKPYMVKS